MEFLKEALPIVIYVLLIIILIAGIVLFIRLIKTLDKVDRVVDDVNDKVRSLNGFFEIIDFTTDKLVGISDRLVDIISSGISKLLDIRRKKKKKKEKIEKEEEDE